MKHRMFLALGLTGLAAATLSVVGVGTAGADYAPQPGDVIGVGGDTPQYALTFLANGDTAGDAGFNSAGAYNRLVTFNATADANGRSAYRNDSTESTPLALNPTDVLRAGLNPVQRVQSSGAAISALLADTHTPEQINFVFSASLPTSGNQTTATNLGWGGLHSVEIGTDSVQVVTDNTTNAPANLTISQLLKVYEQAIGFTTWSDFGGTAGTIVPELPPSTSSVYKTFIAALTAANGTVAPTLGGTVETVEQNDPTTITGASTPADAIVPFSTARLSLYNSGYFHTPNTVYPGGSVITPGVKINNTGSGYKSTLVDYAIFRQKDLASTTPFEPGSSLNWAETLFSDSGGPTPYVATAAGQALIAASGVTPSYHDIGT